MTASATSSPRAAVSQAFAAPLALDEAARADGRADGAAGRPWRPGQHDWLAYASGFLDGQRFGP